MRRENEFRYSKLANILREQILSGYIKPGQYLLSENELCKHYGVSRTSVRKSLDELLKEGLIVKKMGQGTIVSPDVVVPDNPRRTLRIVGTAPSYFADHCMQMMIDAFHRENPQVEVKYLSLPAYDFWDSVQASIELGLQPDLIFLADRQCLEIHHPESFVDLREPLASSFAKQYPRIMSAFRREESVLAAPVTFSPVYLAYNPGLFEKCGIALPKPGWTKEDFIRTAQRLTVDTDGDGITDQYGLSMSSAFSRWTVFALQNGVRFDGPTDRQAILSTLNFLHDLLYRYRIAKLSPMHRHSSEAFVHGKAGMVLTTSIELAGWRNEGLGFEPQVAALPFGDHQSTLLIANAFMLPAACSDRELALQFLEFTLGDSIQAAISRDRYFLSVQQSVNESLWDKPALDSLNIVNDRIENSHFLSEVFAAPSLMDDMHAEMGLFWLGLESAEATTDRILGLLHDQDPSSA
ncbi:extracellular solute-binding protein [Paenibacillus mendelii]|uniref:Extracellular solute-binding protein n=1 Tax=Paenibacillus mendelii TaxID=206163 RepID=A0ABV6JG59_9BACL|nr:extracellular solute-binding protein [Paenibacillus mendelii]MCQ6557746.1 extracellular solute-binding protein [Paenibacillus mendelii]